jgi:hypothetical protein
MSSGKNQNKPKGSINGRIGSAYYRWNYHHGIADGYHFYSDQHENGYCRHVEADQ